MDDSDILPHIEKMVTEERRLRQRIEQGGIAENQRAYLQQLEIYLDQCWDLLRQRHARRVAGLDPADAKLRDQENIELFPQ
jgi:hypothetical protein